MNITRLRRFSKIIGNKWELVILDRLTNGPLRYMEIASQVRDIDCTLSDGVLSKNLKRLTDNGLLRRLPTDDGHHIYNLTTLSKSIVAALEKISEIDDEAPDDEPGDV